MKKLNEKKLKVLANSTARMCGHGHATEILFGPVQGPRILSWVRPGYRKNTTGEYVPKAYLRNFGWKNTYYCHLKCTVLLPLELIDWNN